MRILFLLLLFSFTSDESFKSKQLKYARVRDAYTVKEATVDKMLSNLKMDKGNLELFFRAFKHEQQLEVWVKKKEDDTYQLLKTYTICSSSGLPGPKRKQGDLQVPEGLYHIQEGKFNPYSNLWLSLGLNYPNASDRVLSDKTSPGGDIFIHGNCVTIGCLPMTDDLIKEIYLLAVEARNKGQVNIPVHIFPFRMSDASLIAFSKRYPEHKLFWENIQPAYKSFEKNKKVPRFAVDSKGKYQLQ